MMKRRDALKKIGLGTGFVVATPSLISLLQSCTSDVATWTPTFFTEEQGVVITALVDIILPKTDTPSASEVNVPQFMDKYADEVLDIEAQNRMKTAFSALVAHIKTTYNKNLFKVNEANYKDLLENEMSLNEPATPNELPMTISDVLNSIRWSTINAYTISETIGEKVLAYDPVPGAYYCGDLQELTGGKAYSL